MDGRAPIGFSGRLVATVVVGGGTGTGVFVYNGAPANGNLIASIAPAAGTDQYGNAYVQGIASYNPGALESILNQGNLTFASLNAGTRITGNAQLFLVDAQADNVSPSIHLLSPLTSAAQRAALVLFGTSKDSTKTAQAVLSGPLGGGVPLSTALLEVQGALALLNPGSDSNARLLVDPDGKHHWAPASGASDTTLYRNAASVLKTDAEFDAGSIIISGSAVPIFSVTETTAAPASPPSRLIAAAAADRVLGVQVTGDAANFRLRVDSNGRHDWGPGTGATDTSLYRAGAGILQTDTTLALTNETAPAGLAGAGQLYGVGGQLGWVNPQGLTARIPGAKLASITTNTVTGTAFANLFNDTIPAGDAVIGATYRATVFGYGTWGSTQQQLNFGIRFGAADTNTIGTTPGIMAAAFAASATFRWKATCMLTCVTTGVSATWRANIEGTVTQTANALLPGTAADNTVPFAGGTGSADITLDSTIAETFGLSVSWASTTGAPTISKNFGQFERIA